MVYLPSSSTATTTTMTSTTTTTTTTANSDQIASTSTHSNYLFRQPSSNSVRNSINSGKSNTLSIGGKKSKDSQERTPSSSSLVRSSSRKSDVDAKDHIKCSDAKEALCKRMGALFLRHKVEQLADDVEKMQQQGKYSKCPIQKRMQRKQDVQRFGSSENLSVTNTSTTTTDLTTLNGSSEEKFAQYMDENKIKQKKWKGSSCQKYKFSACVNPCKQQERVSDGGTVARSRDPSLPPSTASNTIVDRIIIADASLLIYSLRTVHEYLKAGNCQVIVPCEALNTLDVLKKGEHTLNWAARRATRFLDERFSQIDDRGDDAEDMQYFTSEKKSPSNLRAGLFPQGLHQRLNILGNQTNIEKDSLDDLNISVEILKEAPLAATKTFDCALFFLKKYQDNSNLSCALAIALPPPHLDFEQEALHADNSCNLRFAERVDGNVMLRWSKESGLARSEKNDELSSRNTHSSRLIVAPTAASWLTVASTIPNDNN